MAPMLGVRRASGACCRSHTRGYLRRNGATRNEERRVTQKWLDEYEDRERVDCFAHAGEYWQGCPAEPPACFC